ncbi:hypothetical protein ALC62_10996 [Cyphomyrmex costatus]|uniref:Uncharacterized protein n=1 Tax=Cyphomyrmex costatus TaxID=456900 RepID=A0A151ID01_9HYME|nr:hypothetical protein ALC62_10996 [Cyphomyrmex costatus]
MTAGCPICPGIAIPGCGSTAPDLLPEDIFVSVTRTLLSGSPQRLQLLLDNKVLHQYSSYLYLVSPPVILKPIPCTADTLHFAFGAETLIKMILKTLSSNMYSYSIQYFHRKNITLIKSKK